jgi:GNAT superfamily N-acetyltransferase
VDRKIVGTISARSHEEQQGHLRGMAVLPKWHGTGTAATLLAAIEDWLRMLGGHSRHHRAARKLETAIAFYEKHGYRRSGNISDFYGMPLME